MEENALQTEKGAKLPTVHELQKECQMDIFM